MRGGGGRGAPPSQHPNTPISPTLAVALLALYPSDARAALSLCRAYGHDPALLRAALSSETPGAPSRLIAAVQHTTPLRVAFILAATRPDVLNSGVWQRKPALLWCVLTGRPELSTLLLASPALAPGDPLSATGTTLYELTQRYVEDDVSRRPCPLRLRMADFLCALSSHPSHPMPDDVFTGSSGSLFGRTALWVALTARSPDLLTAMLADPRATAGVVSTRDRDGDSASSFAAFGVRDGRRQGHDTGRHAAAECVRVLAADPRCDPSALGNRDGTALSWAASAGLPDVVEAWLGDPRVTADVVGASDMHGKTAQQLAEESAGNVRWDAVDREAAGECARLLGAAAAAEAAAARQEAGAH